jgi:hypothetical protein
MQTLKTRIPIRRLDLLLSCALVLAPLLTWEAMEQSASA